MGGCRCTFRGCNISSVTKPKRHFFHYPIRQPERLRKWIKLSGNYHYSNMETSQLRNKVVCQDHFREKWFMNAKQDSLTKTAFPTIVKLKMPNGTYEISEIECVEDDIEDIPHDDKIDLDHNAPVILNNIVHCENDNIELNDFQFKSVTPEVNVPKPKTLAVYSPKSMASSRPKLLNSLANKKNINLVPLTMATTQMTKLTKFTKVLTSNTKKIVRAATSSTSIDIQDEIQPAKRPRLDDLVNDDKIEATSEEFISVEAKDAAVAVVEESYVSLLTAKDLEIEELKKKLAEKDSTISMLKKMPEQSAKSERTSLSTAGTKVQHFIGLKKYLNTSMGALLRMELFGGPERDYKNDEKVFCVELLSQGAEIYGFMQDEWRFRLPPKRDVEAWRDELKNNDDDEFTVL